MAQAPHLFVAPGDVIDGRATIRGGDAHHLIRVLRIAPGMPISLADGSGMVYSARVAGVDGQVAVRIVEAQRVPPPQPEVHVAHALPKGRKLDEVVQRLTELGVERIIPLHSARSQVRLEGAKADKAHRRWSAVAHAAAKQSRRARLPIIEAASSWADHDWNARGVVLWEGTATPLREVSSGLSASDPSPLMIAVGPEGGLTPHEVEASGLRPGSLGPTILRTEFASVAGVVAVMTLAGRFG